MERITKDVADLLCKLEDHGHEAWCVGGCVRDLLLGREPGDWDVTTSALPEETMALFGKAAIPTGLQHGTVTIRTGFRHVEVTTYRTDGIYTDHRRPESVKFTRSLTEDLARRDFTVNAIAMAVNGRIEDPMDGQKDLAAGRLCCVGEPDRRFQEDALRILRGLRFASVLEFSIEEQTAASMRENKSLLSVIAAERIRVELDKLLCGKGVLPVLQEYSAILGVFLPEILPAIGFEQRSRYHCYNVWEHTIHSVEAIAPDPVLRMAMLLHDLGKPACFSVDPEGNGHFYGHPKVSCAMAESILGRLKYDNESRKAIQVLVENHDRPIQPEEKSVGRALRSMGEETLRGLLAVKRADNLAQSPEYRGRQRELDRIEAMLDTLIERGGCFSLKQLAVNGRDLIELGLQGAEIGTALERLLTAVVDGAVENRRETLLELIKNSADKG